MCRNASRCWLFSLRLSFFLSIGDASEFCKFGCNNTILVYMTSFSPTLLAVCTSTHRQNKTKKRKQTDITHSVVIVSGLIVYILKLRIFAFLSFLYFDCNEGKRLKSKHCRFTVHRVRVNTHCNIPIQVMALLCVEGRRRRMSFEQWSALSF